MTARLWFASVPFLLLLGISAFLVLSASDAAQAEDNGPQQVAPVPDAPGQPRVAWGPTRSSVRIEFPANTHDGSQFIYSYGVHLSRLMGDGQWTDWAWATDVHLCPSGTCSALLPDLTESTRYQVRVFARARMGNEGQITYGPASQERSFTTRSSLDPDPPSNFRVEQVSDNRARVAWEAPSHVGESPLSAFSVYARRWTGTDWTDWGWAAGTGADGRTAEPTGYYEGDTRSDFEPETRYQLRALAVNRDGTDDDTRRWSAPSEIVEITTTSPVASEQPSDESTGESVPTTVPTTGSRTTTAKSQAPTGGPPPAPKPPAPTGNPGDTNDPPTAKQEPTGNPGGGNPGGGNDPSPPKSQEPTGNPGGANDPPTAKSQEPTGDPEGTNEEGADDESATGTGDPEGTNEEGTDDESATGTGTGTVQDSLPDRQCLRIDWWRMRVNVYKWVPAADASDDTVWGTVPMEDRGDIQLLIEVWERGTTTAAYLDDGVPCNRDSGIPEAARPGLPYNRRVGWHGDPSDPSSITNIYLLGSSDEDRRNRNLGWIDTQAHRSEWRWVTVPSLRYLDLRTNR